uniref:Uncharacterized protein n=1 Tax=Rhizophora mucronata TaxID=61149 RepID=A0A2P2N248_RHIMU
MDPGFFFFNLDNHELCKTLNGCYLGDMIKGLHYKLLHHQFAEPSIC